MTKRKEGQGELTQLGDIVTPKLLKQIKRRSTGPTPIQQLSELIDRVMPVRPISPG